MSETPSAQLSSLVGWYFPFDVVQTSYKHTIPTYCPAREEAIPILDAKFKDYPAFAIRRTFVTIRDRGGRERRFGIFYRTDPTLPLNESIIHVWPRIKWRGDLMVVQVGKRTPFVHLRNSDLAMLALNRFTASANALIRKAVREEKPTSIPTEMLFRSRQRVD
ncbi:hypothetical protein DFP72DRAFT_1086478 [Ephemerocybe angulata]|uniref:Uncharacterized protein n=1 Tax=Ephemerocybe angulata TaxID=980116 RepID=A0A8H6LRC7_9AGAR|nr:hypothetical protein DFP72DRAFT_1086478 [Tulosesus angulatus]